MGETQERERILVHFSRRFCNCNPQTLSSEGRRQQEADWDDEDDGMWSNIDDSLHQKSVLHTFMSSKEW